MKVFTVRTSDDQAEFISTVIERLGAEVIQHNETDVDREKKKKKKKDAKSEKISPTYLYGAWKDVNIDPDNLRKQAWGRNLES